jgi:3(or 17)beta-hydroxysteroid dehydrogenase
VEGQLGRLDGKVALVTGAGRGIGAATAKRLAAEGANVIVSNRRLETAISVADAIRAAGHEATPLRHDVTAEDDWQAAVCLAATRYGGLDVLVNNAAMMLVKRTEDTTLEEWHAICRVNLDGVFLGTRIALPVMRERAKYTLHGGSIINVSSVGGIVSAGIASAYSMTKGGVRLFTKGTAVEFSRLGYRLRVNSVHPGVIETEMAHELITGAGRVRPDLDASKVKGLLMAAHPIGRFGTVEEVAAAILFLASDDAAFITGSELIVDGGYTAI